MNAEAIDYQAVLADLETRRDQIEAAINAVRAIIASTGVSANGAPQRITPHAFLRLGIAEATKKYLEIVKSKQTLPQIIQALGQGGLPPVKYTTLYAVLRRRESQVGDIMRMGEEWALTEWYPNHPQLKKRVKAAAKNQDNGGANVAPTSQDKKKYVKPKPKTPVTSKSSDKSGDFTLRDGAEKVLRENGEAMHVDKMVTRLAEMGKITEKRSLNSAMIKDKKKRFKLMGGNIFALTEWDNPQT
jgi:hypothetical protein